MPHFKRILCPVDFSRSSYEAVKTAAELALKFSSELYLMHVLTPVPVEAGPAAAGMGIDVPLYEHEVKASDKTALGDMIKKHIPPGIRAHSMVTYGDPSAEIARTAEEKKADLIVISTHGRTGIGRIVFGSVAEKVVRHAKCPVLTLRAVPEEGS